MKQFIAKGATDVSLIIFVNDSSSSVGAGLTGLLYNTASLVCYYVRPGSTAAQLTLATQTVAGAHSDGGFVEVDSTNMPGVYRLDLSDAIVASGVDSVVIMLQGAANMAPVLIEIELVAFNPQDSVRMGQTALPNAAAEASGGLITRGTGTGQLSVSGGRANADVTHWSTTAVATPDTTGYPKVTIKSGTGTGEISLSSGVANANAVQISGDSVAADNAESFFDGTGYAGTNNVIPTVTSVTNIVTANVTQISSDSTAADNAEAFFDGTGYAGTNNVIPTVTTLTNAPSDSSGVTTLLGRLTATRAGYLDNLSAGAVATASKLLKFFQLALRGDSGIATDNSTELGEINADGGSGAGAYANTTDAQEGIRNRGDSAWITATGFSTHSAADVADAVWEEAIADHSGTSGSTAEALAAAGSAGDPWTTSLPGAYTSGQAGFILGTYLTGNAFTRLGAPAGASIAADLVAIKADTAAILIDTNELQTDWTNGGRLDNLLDDVPTTSEFNARTLASASYATAATQSTQGGTLSGIANNTDSIIATLDLIQGAGFDTNTDSLVVISDNTSSLASDVYQAKISMIKDSVRDEYTVVWFKNGVPVTSGITNPAIRVIRRADGTDLIASIGMTEIGSTGSYKYDATGSERQDNGEGIVVVTTATIDSASRSDRRPIGRDE